MSRYLFNRNGGSADEFGHLLALSRLLGAGGVIEGMAVGATASPGMSVVVANGSAAIPTGTYPDSYSYFCASDTSGGDSVTIATAPTSNSRIDAIVAYVNKSATPSDSPVNNPGMLVYAAVAGTASASPAAPGASAIQTAIGAANPYIILANVLVGTNVTQITSGNITDERLMAGIGAYSSLKSWTPTFSGLTVGNGTLTGGYNKVGSLVFWTFELIFGSSTELGTGVDSQFTLPEPPNSLYLSTQDIGTVTYNNSGSLYKGIVFSTGSDSETATINMLTPSANSIALRALDSNYFGVASGYTLTASGLYST